MQVIHCISENNCIPPQADQSPFSFKQGIVIPHNLLRTVARLCITPCLVSIIVCCCNGHLLVTHVLYLQKTNLSHNYSKVNHRNSEHSPNLCRNSWQYVHLNSILKRKLTLVYRGVDSGRPPRSRWGWMGCWWRTSGSWGWGQRRTTGSSWDVDAWLLKWRIDA